MNSEANSALVAPQEKRRNRGDRAAQRLRYRERKGDAYMAAKKRSAKRRYEANKESIKAKAMEWRRLNPDRWREIQRAGKAREKANLSDAYVRNTFGWVLAPIVPVCLVEVKRELLRLQRELEKHEHEKC